VNGTLTQAWASHKSFVKKDGSTPPPEDGGRNPTVNFKGEKRSNETHASRTDPDARLYKKSEGDKSQLTFLCHALMENRNGLVFDIEMNQVTGNAEREAAHAMVKRTIRKPGATLGAEKNYDTQDFVAKLRRMSRARKKARPLTVAQPDTTVIARASKSESGSKMSSAGPRSSTHYGKPNSVA